MNTALRVVALDLSNAATGIAQTHAADGTPRLSVATVPGTAGRPLHDQIDTIEMAVRRACGRTSGNAWIGTSQADVVVVEGTFSRPGGSDYGLHALHGVVKQWLHRVGIPYAEVAPATLKVWATGSGATRGENKVGKDKVIEAVLSTYGGLLNINPRDDNQCDAVALLGLALAAYGQELAPVKPNCRKAIQVPKWPELINQ